LTQSFVQQDHYISHPHLEDIPALPKKVGTFCKQSERAEIFCSVGGTSRTTNWDNDN